MTFKIGDLLRCRFSVSEKKFINVVNALKHLNSQESEIYPFQIVRIKNRLDEKDNDLLINFFFMKKVQC